MVFVPRTNRYVHVTRNGLHSRYMLGAEETTLHVSTTSQCKQVLASRLCSMHRPTCSRDSANRGYASRRRLQISVFLSDPGPHVDPAALHLLRSTELLRQSDRCRKHRGCLYGDSHRRPRPRHRHRRYCTRRKWHHVWYMSSLQELLRPPVASSIVRCVYLGPYFGVENVLDLNYDKRWAHR